MRYVYHKKAQVESVQIDPGYQVTLDRDYLNNSHVDGIAARRDAQDRNVLDVPHPIPGSDDELAGLEEARWQTNKKAW